jgi:hypothetical protein
VAPERATFAPEPRPDAYPVRARRRPPASARRTSAVCGEATMGGAYAGVIESALRDVP